MNAETQFVGDDGVPIGLGANVTFTGARPLMGFEIAALHTADAVLPGAPPPPTAVPAPTPTMAPAPAPPVVTAVCPNRPLPLSTSARRVARRVASRTGRVRSIRRAGRELGRRCGDKIRRRSLVVSTNRGHVYISRFRTGYRAWHVVHRR